MDDDLKRLLDAMRQENEAAHSGTRHHFDEVAQQLRQRSDGVAQQLRQRFDVVAEQLEGRIALVAEGVVANSERIDRIDSKIDGFAADTKNEFNGVRSMITFSHAELDRRIRALEKG